MTWTSTSVPYFTPPEPGQPDPWTASGGTQRLLAVDVVEAPEGVREALRLPESARVVRRSRLIIDAGEPMEVATSYWPAQWAESTALAEPRAVKGGTVRLMADLGWVAATSVEDNSAEIADDVNCPQAPRGAPLLVIRRTMLDSDDQPIEHMVMYRWDGTPQRYVLKAA